MNLEEQIYACKYIDNIGLSQVAKDLGKSKEQVEECVKKLKSNGIFNQYKNMEETQYDTAIKGQAKKRGRPKKEFVKEVGKENIGIDYQKEFKMLTYKLSEAQREIEEYKQALLNVCLKI